MNGKFLLDTNIIISLFNDEPDIDEIIFNAEEVFVPCIAIGELYYGANKSSRIQENTNRITEFTAVNTVLSCDVNTAIRYGNIKNLLKEKGKLIPENDIWIAAITQQFDLTLITKDKHFSLVEKIKVKIV